MKKPLVVLFFFLAVVVVALRASDGIEGVPDALANRPLRDWQLDLTTLGIAWFFLRRAYANLAAGGGLYGVWRGLIYGEKTPDAKARDDARVQATMAEKGLTRAPFPPSKPPEP